MFSLALLLLAAAAVSASSNSIAKAERLLERLDLKNYKDFASDRESTSTDSTDSSSDASRIARAVEAALEAAEMDRSEAPRAPAEFSTKRLRLSTTNRANECGFFSCADVSRATDVSAIEGATATVETDEGSFTARFDAAGVATHVNDQFQFTVTYANGSPDDTFTLSTVTGEFGVNVTSVTIASQATGLAPASGVVFFRVAESSDFDDDTLLTDDESLRAALGSSVIGCDATFDSTDESLTGSATFALSTDGGRTHIVANVSSVVDDEATEPISVTQSQTFGGNVYVIANQDREAEIGLLALPCASRVRIVYDSTLIVTKRAGETSRTGDTLQHPLLYDALKTTIASTSPDFERFIFELRVAAGRTQLRLRDITLDTGVFSDLSHKSKFTPCFRIFPDDDYLVEAYISMRGAAGGFVRAQLRDGVNGNAVVVDGAIDEDALDNAVFDVAEGRLDDLVGDQTDETRPLEFFGTDVSVQIEDCPEFSYFA